MKILRYMAVAAVVVGVVGLPQRPRPAGATGVGAWRAVCHAGRYSLVIPVGWGFQSFDDSGNTVDEFTHSEDDFALQCNDPHHDFITQLYSRNNSAWAEFAEYPGKYLKISADNMRYHITVLKH